MAPASNHSKARKGVRGECRLPGWASSYRHAIRSGASVPRAFLPTFEWGKTESFINLCPNRISEKKVTMSIYKRKRKHGGTLWYAQFYDPGGERRTELGGMSRAAVRLYL